MTEYLAPGVYIEEVPFKSHTIEGVPTSTAAFIDIFEQGPIGKAVKIDSYADFERAFGGLHEGSEASYAIRQYYLNGGARCVGSSSRRSFALETHRRSRGPNRHVRA